MAKTDARQCPYCGQKFGDRPAYEQHLKMDFSCAKDKELERDERYYRWLGGWRLTDKRPDG